MKKILCVLGLLAPLGAAAQSAANAATFDKFMHTVTGGVHNVTFGTGGKALATSPNTDLRPGGGWHRAGSAAIWADAATGGFVDARKASIPISSKVSLPVSITSGITKASAAAALMRCMGHPVCFAASLAAGGAISNWIADAGVRPNDDGSFSVAEQPLFDGYEYSCNPSWGVANIATTFSCSATEACRKAAIHFQFNLGYRLISNNGSPSCFINSSSVNPDQGIQYLIQKIYPSVPDPAGGNWNPATREVVFDRLVSANASPAVVPELLSGGESIERQSPKVRPDSPSIEGEKVVKTEFIPRADGGTSTKETTKTTYYDVEETENGVKITPRTVTTVKVDGVEQPGETVEEKGRPAEDDLQVCGLPNTPACRIEEEGTPEPVQDTHKQDIDEAMAPIKSIADNPSSFLPELPTINWAFLLPTGCAAIPTPGFSPFIEEIDVCDFQSIFHDLMSIVWLMGGVFGAKALFWRSTFAKPV